MGASPGSPSWTRAIALPLLCIAFLSSGCRDSERAAPHAAGEGRPPNIVLIVADDLGWSDLGAYGNDFHETPHLDALARDGLRFTQAYSDANCAPSRANLMTGRYNPRHGIYTVLSGARGAEEDRLLVPVENQTVLAPSEVTFAEILQSAGYATGHFGKWHLGGDPSSLPTGQGFDVNVAGDEAGWPRGYFSPYHNPHLSDGPRGEYLADRLADEAIRFIDEHRDRPFLVYLPFYSVHTPLQGKGELVRKYQAKGEGPSNPVYAAMVESLDAAAGRVLAALEEKGLEQDTLVMFYSDNGGVGGYDSLGLEIPAMELTSNRPLRGGKGTFYEGGVRVPLIVRYPGHTQPGSDSSAVVTNVDFLPTLLELAGLAPPEDREIDGWSFAGALSDPVGGARGRPPIYWHFPGYLEGDPNRRSWRTTPVAGIRDGDFKLLEFFETGEVELYDLARDPGETENLADSMSDKAQSLRETLHAWWRRTGAALPRPKRAPGAA